jgi:hypothetical protein
VGEAAVGTGGDERETGPLPAIHKQTNNFLFRPEIFDRKEARGSRSEGAKGVH